MKSATHSRFGARELVQVWPTVNVLATARSGIALPDEEKLTLDPVAGRAGCGPGEAAFGERIPSHLWISETADLLTSPLTALAAADRVKKGQDGALSRARLLAVAYAAIFVDAIVVNRCGE